MKKKDQVSVVDVFGSPERAKQVLKIAGSEFHPDRFVDVVSLVKAIAHSASLDTPMERCWVAFKIAQAMSFTGLLNPNEKSK